MRVAHRFIGGNETPPLTVPEGRLTLMEIAGYSGRPSGTLVRGDQGSHQ
jgi:hypothetical protein